ncbi:MAG: response regulator [Desulfarculus sp.]|nr:response regulator [Desulfarculus sp.]
MHGLKIMVVDDSATARHYFTGLVEELGHHAVTVSSAHDALVRLSRERFDLVLCDLVMPDMDGLDLLKSLRQQGQELPFLLVTSYGSLATAVQAVRLGADDYILRPVDTGLLAHRIQAVHERHQAALEKRLRQDLEAALATAGAMAHELNQPLMAIMASAELIGLTDDPVRIQELAKTIVEQAQRLGEVTNRLVSLVRYQATPYVGDSIILDLEASSRKSESTS